MKLITLRIVSASLVLGILTVAAGCQQDDDDDVYTRGGVTDQPMAGEPPMDDVLRTAKLREAAVPVEARSAILADLGPVQITSAQQVPTEAGGMMYRVTYIQNGQAQERTYDAMGQRVIEPVGQPTEPATAGQSIPPADAPPGGGGRPE